MQEISGCLNYSGPMAKRKASSFVQGSDFQFLAALEDRHSPAFAHHVGGVWGRSSSTVLAMIAGGSGNETEIKISSSSISGSCLRVQVHVQCRTTEG